MIGWGLVVNAFADDASWNNWQGYLLGPLGLGGKDGDWAFANLGVLAALVLGFVRHLPGPPLHRRPPRSRLNRDSRRKLHRLPEQIGATRGELSEAAARGPSGSG